MTKKERITFHRKLERQNARLAAEAAKDGDFREASDWYRGAAFHQQVADALDDTKRS